MKNVTIFNKVNVGSDHRIVQWESNISLRRKRNKLVRKSLTKLMNLHNREPAFALSMQNKYAAPKNEESLGQEINENSLPYWKELHFK